MINFNTKNLNMIELARNIAFSNVKEASKEEINAYISYEQALLVKSMKQNGLLRSEEEKIM
jgi:hypothetical protein